MYRFVPVFALFGMGLGCGIETYTPGGDSGVTTGSTSSAATFGSLMVDPAAIEFGDVSVGAAGEATVTLTNTSEETLQIVSALVSDEVFTVTGTTDLPGDIEAASNMVLTVSFTPGAATSYSDELKVQVAGELDPASISLSGTGVHDTGTGTNTGTGTGTTSGGTGGTTSTGGSVDANPSSVPFGSIEVGRDIGSQDVVITNNTSGDVLIDDLSCTDAAFYHDQLGDLDPPELITSGNSKVLTLMFEPSNITSYSGTCSLITDSSETPSVDLSVNGQGIEPSCTICNPIIAVNTGGSSDTQMEFFSALGVPATATLTIRNESDVDLTISGHDIDNSFALTGSFSASGITPSTISAWGSIGATVEYICSAPNPVCIDVGYLNIHSDASNGSTYTIELIGAGI